MWLRLAAGASGFVLARLLLVGSQRASAPQRTASLQEGGNHLYFLHLWPGSVGDSLKNFTPVARNCPTRRFEEELASTFEGLLETQDPDEGRGYSLGAGCQRDSDGSAAASLVEVQARRERHAVLF